MIIGMTVRIPLYDTVTYYIRKAYSFIPATWKFSFPKNLIPTFILLSLSYIYVSVPHAFIFDGNAPDYYEFETFGAEITSICSVFFVFIGLIISVPVMREVGWAWFLLFLCASLFAFVLLYAATLWLFIDVPYGISTHFYQNQSHLIVVNLLILSPIIGGLSVFINSKLEERLKEKQRQQDEHMQKIRGWRRDADRDFSSKYYYDAKDNYARIIDFHDSSNNLTSSSKAQIGSIYVAAVRQQKKAIAELEKLGSDEERLAKAKQKLKLAKKWLDKKDFQETRANVVLAFNISKRWEDYDIRTQKEFLKTNGLIARNFRYSIVDRSDVLAFIRNKEAKHLSEKKKAAAKKKEADAKERAARAEKAAAEKAARAEKAEKAAAARAEKAAAARAVKAAAARAEKTAAEEEKKQKRIAKQNRTKKVSSILDNLSHKQNRISTGFLNKIQNFRYFIKSDKESILQIWTTIEKPSNNTLEYWQIYALDEAIIFSKKFEFSFDPDTEQAKPTEFSKFMDKLVKHIDESSVNCKDLLAKRNNLNATKDIKKIRFNMALAGVIPLADEKRFPNLFEAAKTHKITLPVVTEWLDEFGNDKRIKEPDDIMNRLLEGADITVIRTEFGLQQF